MFAKCIFCSEPRDGLVDHAECDRAGVAMGGHYLVAASIGGDDY
jgi:hypothetical protein